MNKVIRQHRTSPLLQAAAFGLVLLLSTGSHAFNGKEICEQPLFKQWKAQQAQRLWSPNEQMLAEEKNGKVFVYNCLTDSEIDDFLRIQGDRLENAHFLPILNIDKETGGIVEDDNDC